MVCVATLMADSRFDRGRIFGALNLRSELARFLVWFVPGATILTVLMVAFEPERLLAFPLTNERQNSFAIWRWLIRAARFELASQAIAEE